MLTPEAQFLHQPPELFSKAGLTDWLNNPRKPGDAPGNDELWKPGTKEPHPRTSSSDFNFSTDNDYAFGRKP